MDARRGLPSQLRRAARRPRRRSAQNGTRVYLGDDAGALIAIDAADCSQAWAVPLDSQIFGSIAASSDGRELYAASAGGIFQVFDDGASGRRGWTAALDLYDVPPDLSSYAGMNLLLTGVGANGLLIQAGVGIRTGTQALPVRTGIVHVDRLTGAPRWFADGLEESLGAMSTGPDGALYLPHAPLRRAFSLALGFTTEPLVGGLSKWASTRDDLLARDAACAAADRAANAARQRTRLPGLRDRRSRAGRDAADADAGRGRPRADPRRPRQRGRAPSAARRRQGAPAAGAPDRHDGAALSSQGGARPRPCVPPAVVGRRRQRRPRKSGSSLMGKPSTWRRTQSSATCDASSFTQSRVPQSW